MLTFELPWIALLGPLPWLVYRLWPEASREDPALMVPFYDRLPTTDGVMRGKATGRLLSASALVLIWFALLLASARPMWIGDPINLPASGRDLQLAVDISGSMETRDMQWQGEQYDRLSIVKAVVGDFVQRRESDRLGLILFGTRAYVQAPLTFDRITVNQLLQEAQLGFAGEKTAIGDAIGMAVKRLREGPGTDNTSDQQGRVLILLTDGANTAGQVTPLKAAQLAQQAKLKIYTIGVGADEMVKPGLFGSGFGARRINPSVDLDEDTLRSIAEQTGGQYFRARSPQDLQLIYQELDRLEPIEQDSEVFRPTQALFYWPLGAALTLVALLILRHLVLSFWSRSLHTGGRSHD
ncbi:VWA domain-containing protein [Pseudomaricurvus alkylphenolicus]|jgi:Ca-activated chloride channel family protein|uniref:vWA domain-containing protein n=1 Tax=Pseudomaricurvus alkylphenolicus TaxID=1306991 RepID=UPI00141DFD80|nr:VWA domain-containing protein [Pseudomaricurvus alkylphenolicus]NIB44565.1 VWA domain-containing protein [Pseudomaricurvus alkylphenolicus]